MSSHLANVIQNLTAELDHCKRRVQRLEKENEALRQRLTAALTAAASAGMQREVSTGPLTPGTVNNDETFGEGTFDATTGSTSETSPHRGGIVPSASSPDFSQRGGCGSAAAAVSSSPLVREESFHALAAAAAHFDAATVASNSSAYFTLRPPSLPSLRAGGGGPEGSSGPGSCLGSHSDPNVAFHHTPASGTSTSALVASLRRKAEAYERREASWKEQVASLSRQLDMTRAEKAVQIQALQRNLEDIAVQLRESQLEVQHLRSTMSHDPMSQSLVAPPTSTAAVGGGAPPAPLSNASFGRNRARTIVLKQAPPALGADSASISGSASSTQAGVPVGHKGEPELFAEMSREELEDVFVSHASHVRTRSNNLVPISAITSGAAPLSSGGIAPVSGVGADVVGALSLSGGGTAAGALGAGAGTSMVPPNPNQLGEVLTDTVKDKRWYVHRVIRSALKKALNNDRGFCLAGMDAASASSSKGAAGPGEASSPGRSSVLPTLQGKSLSVVSLMVKENYELYFYLKDNQVVMTDSPVHNLPPFHKQNADPNLLQAFSSSATGTNSSDANGAGSTSGPGNFSWLNARADQVRVIFPGPTIFSYIRAYLRFDVTGFLRAVEDAVWRESLSPGKSDASMYYFGNFVIKSVKESEYRFLKDTYIGMFAKYVEVNPNTLICKFFALFSVYWLKRGTRRHFVVMNNVFWTKHYINKIYDIKGSTAGRDADAQVGARTAYGALLLKDNDLPPQLIICGPLKRASMLAQLRSDTSFLSSLSVVDYSCIIGIRTRVFTKENRHRELLQRGASSLASATVAGGLAPGGANDGDLSLMSFTSADGGILSLPIYAENDASTVREDTYYVGLIDVLQTYTPQKRLEHFAKGLLLDRHSISVVPPAEFSERLCKIIERITV